MSSASMSSCVACEQPLWYELDPGSGSYVDDDVQLQCGCHFHWQCLLDAYSMTECPTCGRNLVTTSGLGEQQLLCNLKNEGGIQERLDILPILTEESYLKAYPEERRSRAFLEFCGEGDIEAIVDLLKSHADDDDDEDSDEDDEEAKMGRDIDVLRYQDQLGSGNSGFHTAIQNGQQEVAWLLLFLASILGMDQFPAEVLEAAQRYGLQREEQNGKIDIRALRDTEGRTAEQLARSMEGIWDEWLGSNRLKPPDT